MEEVTDNPTFATCSFPEFRDEMGHPVRASMGKPKYPLRYELFSDMWEFTPRGFYLRRPYDQYREAMYAQLDRYGVEHIRNVLEGISCQWGRTPVLLCFEQLDRKDWCHRTMLREWWAEKTGELVPELGATRAPKAQDATSDDVLF